MGKQYFCSKHNSEKITKITQFRDILNTFSKKNENVGDILYFFDSKMFIREIISLMFEKKMFTDTHFKIYPCVG